MGAEVATVALLAASGVQAYGAYQEGRYQRYAAEAQARQLKAKAVAERLQQVRAHRQALSRMRNLQAARGQAASGTALTLLSRADEFGQLRIDTAYQQALSNARLVAWQGRTASHLGLLKAGAHLLTGAGRVWTPAPAPPKDAE